MYHDLVDDMMNDPMDQLLAKLEEEGFKYVEGDLALLTDREVEEAWEHFRESSPEMAVDFLETQYNFLFERV